MQSSSARVFIVGVGSPFGDDRAGWVAADMLSASPLVTRWAGAVHVSHCDTPASLLLQDYGAADALVVIDAVASGAPPGTVQRLCGAELGHAGAPWSSHGLHIADVLALGQAMHALPPQVLLYGVELESEERGEALSESVARALPALVRRIEDDLVGLLRTRAPEVTKVVDKTS
jgi:hydrogenase maturation protease